MRILIGADTYAPDVNGASYFAQRLTGGLAARGHEVHLVRPSRTTTSTSSIVDACAPADGHTTGPGRPGATLVEHRIASLPVPRPRGFRISPPVRLVNRVRTLLIRIRPDVVHVQSHVLIGRALTIAANELGIAVVATTHMVPDNLTPYLPLGPRGLERARTWFWRAAAEVLGRADVVTAPTPYAARLAESHGVAGPVLPVSNGLDRTRFHPDRDPTGFCRRHRLENRPTVGYLGRLDQEKNLDELVTAFALLRRSTDAQLLLVGDGDRRRQLAALARRLEVDRDVLMTGALADHEIPDAYAAMDVFVHPGTAELQSLVTLEAMATARPVIAVSAGALPHLVHHGRNGYLYRHGDSATLARHLRHLLTDRDAAEQAGRHSLEIVGRHTLAATLSEFETLYVRAVTYSRTSSVSPAARKPALR